MADTDHEKVATSSLSSLEGNAISFLIGTVDSNTVVSFSGGKDSLVALDLAHRIGVKRAVFCDTTIEFDETVQYVDDVARFYGIAIDVVRPPLDFFTLMERVTAPSRRQRWCCDVFKFGPMSRWGLQNGVTAFVTGLRRNESSGRNGYTEVDQNPMVPITQLNPLLDWTEDDVWSYINTYKLPINPLYEHFSRIGCWCCPYKSSSEWQKIQRLFPQKAALLKKNLENLTDRLGIKDKETFIDKYGWTYWIHSTKKVSMGISTVCQGGDSTTIILAADNGDQLERIAKLLPALTSDFRIIGNRLRVSLKDISKQRRRILIERALNCVGCGACLSYCVNCALHLENGSIAVDVNSCTQCQACLNAATLKGSCIARHYSPRRAALIALDESSE